MTRDLNALRSPEMTDIERKGIALSRQISCEGSVLLSNNGVLPLSPCSVALFGYGARHLINTGIGSGDVSARYETQVEDGLKALGFTIVNTPWLDEFDRIYADYRKDLKEELQRKSEETGIDCIHVWYSYSHEHIATQPITEADMPDAEAAVYVLSRKEGEGRDNSYEKGNYLPADWEIEQIRTLRSRYDKLILLLNIGSVLDMQEINAIGPDAVLVIYQGGAELGAAAADMIAGIVPPSGKLTTTWAKDYMDYSSSACFGPNLNDLHVPYKEGIYIGYRYFDSFRVRPAYPFGYGLTYTDFRLDPEEIRINGSEVCCDIRIENTGSRPGKEIVQLYLSAPWGKLDKPFQELAAFAKSKMLEPGEKELLHLTFRLEDHVSYDSENAVYLLEKGDYKLRLGNCSDTTHVCALLKLDEDIILRKVKNLFEPPVVFDDMKPAESIHEEIGDVPVLMVQASSLSVQAEPSYNRGNPNYLNGDCSAYNLSSGPCVQINVPHTISLDDVKAGKYSVEEFAGSMNTEELIHLVTGQYYEHKPYKMYCYSPHVLGACGETTNYFDQSSSPRNIPYLITCDGGSGIHLTEKFQTDADDNIRYLDPVLVFEHGEFGIPDYDDSLPYYYQYTTALPIPTQQACTWNPSLIEAAADIVGQEMERYGIDIWLAPGMNLHRNPLGGRNFEYYSEDPVLTSMIASAITRGVQKHPGKGVCIKHFAANNQETNRTGHIACVSERTMREMYLRGFFMTIRDANPFSIMTSLNCVNGPHGTNSKELATYILGDEWSFDGLIMTDWNTTRADRGGSTAMCIEAGDHLIMPGSERDLSRLRRGIRTDSPSEDRITLGDLQHCAIGFLKAMLKLRWD
ncbi:MAG: glycoside hydrolase family 3 C-terminal domain-containing protein [Solobacterium sp.]|nr:glycoside hydrolase family 3 C-terminal domain-containing protein [Solobacterium sp.]